MGPLRKRRRSTKVCDFCKRRKIKCDLAHPCEACTKSSRPCVYLDDASPSAMATAMSFTQTPILEPVLATPYQRLSDARTAKLSVSSAESNPELDALRRKVLELEMRAAQDTNFSAYNASPMDHSPLHISPHHLIHTPLPLSGCPAPRPVSHDQYAYLFGHNPLMLPSDTISFYDGYCPLFIKEPYKRRATGPLSWISILRADRALSLLWDELHSREKQHHPNPFEVAKDANEVDRVFSKKFSEESGESDLKLYQDQDGQLRQETPKCPGSQSESVSATASGTPTLPPLHKSVDRVKLKARINSKARTLGIQFYRGTLDADMEVLEKVKLVLPNRKALWLLVDRFFTALYPFMPYLDELLFKGEIARLLGPATTEPTRIESINVQRRLDFAYLGILLLVLRLSYVSLFTNTPHENEKCMYGKTKNTCQFMMNNPIEVDVAKVSQDCLNTFNLMKGINMTVMQLAVFTRLYRMYAPDDGDGSDSGESSVFNSMLLQMAYLLGLNRDPDNYPEVCADERLNNLGRKIWYFLLILDTNNSASSGVPLSTGPGNFDTKTPFYQPGNENICDIAVEKFTVDRLKLFRQSFHQIADMLRAILNVNSAVPVPLLVEHLNMYDIQFRRFFFELRQSFAHTRVLRIEGLDRTLRLKVYFSQFHVHMTLNFHMFRYYEMRQENLCAYYYAKKMTVLLVTDMIPFYFDTVVKSRDQVDHPIDFIVTPSFIMAAHMGLILITSVFIRVRLETYALRSAQNDGALPGRDSPMYRRYHLLHTLLDQLECTRRILLEYLKRISSRYYHAWRITRVQHLLSGMFTSEEFYERILEQPARIWFKLEDHMLEELATIYHDSLQGLKLNHQHDRCPAHAAGPLRASDVLGSASSISPHNKTSPGYDLSASLEQLPLFYSNFFGTADGPAEDHTVDNMWVQMMQLRSDNQPPLFDQDDLRSVTPRDPDAPNGTPAVETPMVPGVGTPQAVFTNLQAYSPRSFNYATFGEDEFDMLLMGDLLREFPQV